MPSDRKTKDESSQLLESSLPNGTEPPVDTQKEILLSPETTSLVIQTESIQESANVIPEESNNSVIPNNNTQNSENNVIPQVDEQKVSKSKKSKGTSATKTRKSKKSKLSEAIQEDSKNVLPIESQTPIMTQTDAGASKESLLKTESKEPTSETFETTETQINYETEYKKLKANFSSIKDDLKSKDLAIKELKSEIDSLRKKIKSYEKLEALDKGTNLWKEAAYGMSQFIADKTGYTQSQILKKFGAEDD